MRVESTTERVKAFFLWVINPLTNFAFSNINGLKGRSTAYY